MIETPESCTFAKQAVELLAGKTITDVFNATHPHKFTWYKGDPADYKTLLVGKKVRSAEGHGAFLDLHLDDETHIALSDGVIIRYYTSGSDVPPKYQLLITFDDDSFLVFTVAMYGGIIAFQRTYDNPYYQGALTKPSPLNDRFDAAYFRGLVAAAKPNLSAKAFLATEQRIPGLGNGVLQDILFKAKIHPKRKLATMGEEEFETIFSTVKSTLKEMTDRGGRDTEKNLLGEYGGYHVLLSKNTYTDPCPVCGGMIVKEAYLGGAVYYCPHCQPLK
ncbi:DNA-formamidopyrimidine glycosylase family protein [uncultured Alistipes sp.]|uniref:DNA-formamidopyrimidine glycosylase family protein n=1 Tax=uncultured Alistipes sp. TaxID=538949 RepID=UPI0025D52071|nr:DNA-formamidopyrimidine glycosylase family protein [uncultured Alistipes sp.]